MYGLNDMTDHKYRNEEERSLSESPLNYCDSSETFRNNLKNILHSYRFHLIIVALVIIDCIIVVVELMIDLETFRTECPTANTGTGNSTEHHSTHPTAHVISEVLHLSSIAILCLFSVEILFKVYAFRIEYFKHKVEVFDAFIVFTSLILDLVFLKHEDVLKYIGIVVVLRLWRIIRVVHGIAISVTTPLEHNYEKEKKKREKLDKEMAELYLYVDSLEIEIMKLRSVLSKNNISEELPQTYLKVDRKV